MRVQPSRPGRSGQEGVSSRRVAISTAVVMGAVLVGVAALVVISLVRQMADQPGQSGQSGQSGGSGAGQGPSAPFTRQPATRQPSTVRASLPDAVRAVVVLRDWDRARAAAWRSGDIAALRRLYVDGSKAGENDRRSLAAWVARGLRVEGMRMQVFEVKLQDRSDNRLVLLVTDRVTGAVAVRTDGRGRWKLPQDQATTRRLELRRVEGRWRLVSAYDRPLSKTASTSASAKS